MRTGPRDWFGSGRVEAVRAALGVEAGTDLAAEVGIPSALPEPTAVRLERAGRVALLGVGGVTASAGADGTTASPWTATTRSPSASRPPAWRSPSTERACSATVGRPEAAGAPVIVTLG